MKECFVSPELLASIVKKPDQDSLREWMWLGAPDVGDFGVISREDLEQRFALSPYIQMVKNGISEDELVSRILEDARAYIEEYVLKTKIGIKEFSLRDGDLHSDKYGEKSFLTMCRDTVLAREEQGLPVGRARHEGLGVANIVKLLEVASEGQVVVLVSPPYGINNYDDSKPYSMVYLYQKQQDGRIWFGAVRDDDRSITDWQEFAAEESLWQTDWGGHDDLKFVALPMVAKKDLSHLLHDLGVSGVEQIPEWMEREARLSAEMLVNNLVVGNNTMAQRVLDAFKMVVVTGRQQTGKSEVGLSVARTVGDIQYGWMLHQMFINSGGDKILAAGGMCGGDGLVGEWNKFDLRALDNNVISSALGINENMVTETTGKMECVKCPFCHKTVDAILTSTKIICPSCNAEASRS